MKPTYNTDIGINIGFANTLLSEKDYVSRVGILLQKSIKTDATLVMHSDEEIARKYQHSLVVIEKSSGNLIGNASIYPTTFKCLSILESKLMIGETGSTVVDPMYRGRSIGKELILEADRMIGSNYDAIIGATINPRMTQMRQTLLGYELVPFPKDLYEEGRAFFSSRLPGGVTEFEKRAVCMLKVKSKYYRCMIMDVLLSQ